MSVQRVLSVEFARSQEIQMTISNQQQSDGNENQSDANSERGFASIDSYK